VEMYKQQIDETIDSLKVLPKAEGFGEILMPGEPEQNTLADRTSHGIPLPPGTVERLRVAAGRFDVPLPVGVE
jgi:LDH2 family malate/lactate/ureidoglycolate dehydrogenase